MTVKRRDFQKAVNFLQEFLLKLSESHESAELRDSLNMCLLHLQKYYKTLKSRTDELVRDPVTLSSSFSRGFSPMTPFRDAPDRFQWKWVNLENPSIVNLTRSLSASEDFSHIPSILQATKVGDVQTVNRIISQDGVKCLTQTDALGRNCVMYAVHYKQNDLLQFYLQQPVVDVNFKAQDESRAIHRACHDNNEWALRALINKKADLNAEDVEGRTPLHWASTIKEDTVCLDILIESGANTQPKDSAGMTPCMWACRMDCKMAFDRLRSITQSEGGGMETGSWETDDKGWTWVHWSVRRTEPLDCLTSLLNEKSGFLKDDSGRLPIHVAAELGASSACKLIIEVCGWECVNSQDSQGRTPLHLAALSGHGEIVNVLCEKGADLLIEDEHKATAWDYAKGSQLRYCMLILQYYREKQDGTTLSMETSGNLTSRGGQSTEITPRGRFLSPRPPEMPQGRSTTPNTPRSRLTGRSSAKRSSMAASINGSISPVLDDDRGLSTYRSSTTSLHGPVYPQKKVKPNSPREENPGSNVQPASAQQRGSPSSFDRQEARFKTDDDKMEVSPERPNETNNQNFTQNILVLNGDEADNEEENWDDSWNVDVYDQNTHNQRAQNNKNEEDFDQNTYEIERPASPARSDATDVSLPMNVSDVDDNDPPTVIHRPPEPETGSTRQKPMAGASPPRIPQSHKKITLDMGSNLLHGNIKGSSAVVSRPELKSTVFNPVRSFNDNSSFGLPEQLPNAAVESRNIPSKAMPEFQPQVLPGSQRAPASNLNMQINQSVPAAQQKRGRVAKGPSRRGTSSPNQLSQSLSPDSSLSISANNRTAVHSGVKVGPSKRAISESPAKTPLASSAKPLKNEEAAALKEQQLADIQFTPLHRRASPGGHLEPLSQKLTSSLPTHTLLTDDGVVQKRGRKNTRRAMKTNNEVNLSTSQSAHPRSGRLQPLEASIQGSSYPIYHSAKRRDPNTGSGPEHLENTPKMETNGEGPPAPAPRKNLAAPLTANARKQGKLGVKFDLQKTA